jgi:hypothetical protein
VDIHPEKSTLNFATTPPGLQILLDGQPVQTPVSVVSVVGMLRTIEAITPQLADGFSHTFEFWSNGGDHAQTLKTPAEDLTLVAHFNSIVGVESLPENYFSFFPNPVMQDRAILRMFSTSVKTVTIRLVNVLSHTLIAAPVVLVPGENRIPLDLGPVQNGVYFLILEEDNGNTALRLVMAR